MVLDGSEIFCLLSRRTFTDLVAVDQIEKVECLQQAQKLGPMNWISYKRYQGLIAMAGFCCERVRWSLVSD